MLEAIIARYVIKDIRTDDDGLIKTTVGNFASLAEVDSLYNKIWQRGAATALLAAILKDTKRLHGLNVKYFAGLRGDMGKGDFNVLSKVIQDGSLLSLGYNDKTKAPIKGGPVHSLLNSFDPANQIKQVIHRAITSNNATLSSLSEDLKKSISERSIISTFVDSQIPDVYDKIDRTVGATFASRLGLRYAIYQGGLIATSREFCIHRNGLVFTDEEIRRFGSSADHFGGYTNKSAGEFQGKNDGYDPERDLGGYNCRHHLDWISEALAFRLRPELRKSA